MWQSIKNTFTKSLRNESVRQWLSANCKTAELREALETIKKIHQIEHEGKASNKDNGSLEDLRKTKIVNPNDSINSQLSNLINNNIQQVLGSNAKIDLKDLNVYKKTEDGKEQYCIATEMPEGWSKLKSIPPDLTQNFNNNKVSVYLPPDLRLTVDSTQYTLPDEKSNQSLREIKKRIYNKQELEQAAKQVCVLGSISKLILQQIDEKRCGYDVTLKFDLNSSITAEKNTLTADNKAKWQKLDTLPTNLFEGSNKDLNRFTYSEGLYIHGKMIDDKLQIVVTDKKPITVETDETYHIQRGGRALPIANIDKGGNIQEQSAEAIIKRVTQYIGEYKLKSLIKDIYNTKADEDTEISKNSL